MFIAEGKSLFIDEFQVADFLYINSKLFSKGTDFLEPSISPLGVGVTDDISMSLLHDTSTDKISITDDFLVTDSQLSDKNELLNSKDFAKAIFRNDFFRYYPKTALSRGSNNNISMSFSFDEDLDGDSLFSDE